MPSHKITFPPDLSSCPLARHFVTSHLAEVPEEVRSTAALLTSEIVTNVILHTGGPFTLEVQDRGDRYRIEVADLSKIPPQPKPYDPDDATGHGLQLLNQLATGWGWRPLDSGKVVWFEISLDSVGEPSTLTDSFSLPQSSRRDLYPSGMPIALLGAPVQAMIRVGAHYDALYREFRLIVERDPSKQEAIPGRLLQRIHEFGTEFLGFGAAAEEAWGHAVRRGDDTST